MRTGRTTGATECEWAGAPPTVLACSYWSAPVSFGWFFQRKWEYEYGRDWAFQLCQEFYDYDGRRENFVMELEPKSEQSGESLDRVLQSPARALSTRHSWTSGGTRDCPTATWRATIAVTTRKGPSTAF